MTRKAKQRSMSIQHDADFKAALRALKRAAKRAKETALLSGTPLVFWQDGRVKTVRPDAGTQIKRK